MSFQVRWASLFLSLYCVVASGQALGTDVPDIIDGGTATAKAAPKSSPAPAVVQPVKAEGSQIAWTPLLKQSFFFIGMEHGYRWLTQAGTRDEGIGVGRGYRRSIGNLHGWADGDDFVT